MTKIIYHGGSLFNAPKDKTILIHAVNCMGRWGSGIAIQFKKRFPEAHTDYQTFCESHHYKHIIGKCIQFHQIGLQSIGGLFTSIDYGSNVDPVDQILLHTKSAMRYLLDDLPEGYEIHAPKINSGLFRVPWEKTEAEIEKVLANKDVKFHVWEG